MEAPTRALLPGLAAFAALFGMGIVCGIGASVWFGADDVARPEATRHQANRLSATGRAFESGAVPELLQPLLDATTHDMPQLLMEACASKLAPGDTARTVQPSSLVLSRWAQLDPEGGVQFLLDWDGSLPGGKPDKRRRDRALAHFFGQWSTNNREAALAAALALEDPRMRRGSISSILKIVSSRDPAGFFELIKTLPEDVEIRQSIGTALSHLVAEDPEAALAQLDGLPESALPYALKGLATGWAATDPEAAFKWLIDLDEGKTRVGAMVSLFELWSLSDPWRAGEAYLEALAAGWSSHWRIDALAHVLRSMARDDLTRAVDWIVENNADDEPYRGKRHANLFEIHSELVRLLVARGGDEMVPRLRRLLAENQSLASELHHHPSAERVREFAKLFAEFPQVMASESASFLASSLYNVDPVAGKEFIGQLPSANLQALAWRGAASWEGDFGAALTLLENAPENVRQSAITGFAKNNSFPPDQILAELDRLEEAERVPMMTELLHYWTNDDPHAAIEWSNRLTAPAERRLALRRIASVWSRHDYTRTSAWVATLDAGPERDGAIGGMLENIVELEPAAALEWAAAISEPQQRERELSEVLREWRQRAPDEVAASLQSLELPAGLAQQLEETLQKP